MVVWAALLAVSVAVLGFIPTNDLPIREGKTVLAVLALLVLAGRVVSNRWVRYFFWTSLLSHVLAYNHFSYHAMVGLTAGVMAWEVLASGLCKTDIMRIMVGLRVITLCQLALMFSQYIGYDPIFVDKEPIGRTYITGFLVSENTAGAFLAIMVPLFMRRYWALCLPLLAAAIYMTHSAGAVVVAAIVACWCSAYLYGKRVTWAIAIAAVIGIAVYSGLQENLLQKMRYAQTHRFTAWRQTVKLAAFKPVLLVKGWGIGQYKAAFPAIAETAKADFTAVSDPNARWYSAHNEYLQVLFEQGLLGLAWLLIYLGTTWRACRRWLDDRQLVPIVGAWLGCLLVAGYLFPMRLAGLAIVFLVVSACIEAIKRYGFYSRAY